MAEDTKQQLTIETRVKGDDVRVVVDGGGRKLGTLVLSNQTICWAPEGSNDSDESRKMTWVMTWEQFSEVMQSLDIGEVVRLSQSAYASAARAGAGTVPHEAGFDAPMPKAREKLGLCRHFNNGELALIRKGYSPVYDDKWIMYFDSSRSELRMYRTWTGHCVFSMSREDSNGAEISESWVSRDREHYGSTDTKHDAQLASWLIDVFLLGRNRDYPSESNSETNE
jgi:hypothetical protein